MLLPSEFGIRGTVSAGKDFGYAGRGGGEVSLSFVSPQQAIQEDSNTFVLAAGYGVALEFPEGRIGISSITLSQGFGAYLGFETNIHASSIGISRLHGYVRHTAEGSFRYDRSNGEWRLFTYHDDSQRESEPETLIRNNLYPDYSPERLEELAATNIFEFNPAAQYLHARERGDVQGVARAAMALPFIYDDAPLRAVATGNITTGGYKSRLWDPSDSGSIALAASKDYGKTYSDTSNPSSVFTGPDGYSKGFGNSSASSVGSNTPSSWSDSRDSSNSQKGAPDSGRGSGNFGKSAPPDVDWDSPGPKPIILDLDGNGLSVTELAQSTHFVDGGDGLQHRTAWAGVGDGVLFFDVSGDGQIKEKREYVFTEWDPTAASDLEALRSVFDTNGDGKLTAADAGWGSFKVLVTNGDGTTEAKTLAQLGITEINLLGDTTRIELPDGSVIAGKSTFTRSNGTTGTVGDMILAMDAQGHRLEQTQSTVNGLLVREVKAYDADGSIAYRLRVESDAITTGLSHNTRNFYDDNGDGVFDRVQTILRQNTIDGVVETVRNYIGADVASGVLQDAKVTTTLNNQNVTIQRDSLGGGWFDQVETWVKNANGTWTITVSDKAQNGATIRSTQEEMSANGLSRTERFDEDGNGTFDRVVTQVIQVQGNGDRIETTTTKNADGTTRSIVEETISADGRSRVMKRDVDGSGGFEDVENLAVTVLGTGATSSVKAVYNQNGSLRSRSVEEQSADTLTNTRYDDLDGDGRNDRTTLDQTVIAANGDHTQTLRVTNADGSIRALEKTFLAANKIDRQIWVDQNQNGVFEATDLVEQTVYAASTQQKTQTSYDRNADGSVNSVKTAVTNATGLITTTTIDRDNSGSIDTRVSDAMVLNANGSTTRTIETRNGDNSLRGRDVVTSSADGRTVSRSQDVDGDGVTDSVVTTVVSNQAGGVARTQTQKFAGNGTTLLSQERVDETADRRVKTALADTDGNGTWDAETTTTQAVSGANTIDEKRLNPDGSLAVRTLTDVSDDGLVATTRRDLNGDGVYDVSTVSTTTLPATGSRVTTVDVLNGNNSLRSKSVTTVSDDGLMRTVQMDANGDNVFERKTITSTILRNDGRQDVKESVYALNNVLLSGSTISVSDDRRVTISSQDRNGDLVDDLITTSTETLEANGTRVVVSQTRRADGSLVSGKTTTTSDDGRYITTTEDVDGNNTVDHQTVLSVDSDGTRYLTTTHLDALQNIQRVERDVAFGNGTWRAEKIDRDGDGAYDATVATTIAYNANGTIFETIRHQSENTTTYRTDYVTRSDDGLTVTREEDWNNDGGRERKSVQTTSYAVTGVVTETSELRAQNNALLRKEQTVTSADGRTVTTTLDKDGNGVSDVTTTVQKVANGSVTTTKNHLSTTGALKASFVETVSDDGLSVTRTSNLDGSGAVERSLSKSTTIASNGQTTTLETHTTAVSVASGFVPATIRKQVVTSDDGLVVTTSLDTNTTNPWDSTAIATRVFGGNGSVTDTTETRNAANTFVGRVVSSVSGNGLSQTSSFDLDGNGGNERVRTRTETAIGDITESVSDFRANGALLQNRTTVITDDGRQSVQNFDRDGNNTSDQRITVSLDENQLQSSLIEDLNAMGAMQRKALTTENSNGLTKTSRFDIDGDGSLDIIFTSEKTFAANGDVITTVTESYGNGQASLVQVTTANANGLGSTTSYDLNGDGTNDATRTSTTTAHADGRVGTVTEVRYANQSLQSRTTREVSADERLVTETYDYDGNARLDLMIQRRELDNGSMSVTNTSYDTAGNQTTSFTKTTSADGLVVTSGVVGQQIQTVKQYSPLGNGSYTAIEWENRLQSSEYTDEWRKTILSKVDYEIDAGGIATWSYNTGLPSETYVDWGNNAHVNKTVRLTNDQRNEYIAQAQRVYDTLLDRDMYENEIDALVRFVGRDGLDEERLAESLMGTSGFADRYPWTGTIANFAGVYYADVYGRAPTAAEIQAIANQMHTHPDESPHGGYWVTRALVEAFVEARDRAIIADEFDTRYGTGNFFTNAEFVTQIYQNSFGRMPSLGELSQAITDLSPTGGKSRADLAIDLAESAEHLVRGNVHESTNNFDLRINPTRYERTLDRAYAKEVVGEIYFTVHNVAATIAQIDAWSNWLLTGNRKIDQVAWEFLQSAPQSPQSLHGLTGAALVNRAFLNSLGRAPSTSESTTWTAHLSAGRISLAEFVSSIAVSVDADWQGRGSSGADSITGGVYTDLIYGWAGADTLDGAAGDDTIYAGTGNDIVTGGEGDDLLSGDEDNDSVSGGNGSDTLLGGWGDDTLEGADGNDRLDGGVGNDFVDGGGGSDLMIGWTGDDFFYGRWGNDTVYGGDGNDTIEGHNDNDLLYGENGNDQIKGDAGNDTIDGGEGADTAWGGDGNDLITGGNGADSLMGNWGDDVLEGGDGSDTIDGGVGNDTLDGGGDADRMIGWTGDDLFWGRWGNDTVYGGDGNDSIHGHNDHDALYGENGNDWIQGDLGNDWLDGGAGADTLIGGSGSDGMTAGVDTVRDVFVFASASDSAVGSTRDKIWNFKVEDVLDFGQIDANENVGGNQAFAFSGTTVASHSVWYAISGGSVIVRGDVNGDLTPDFEIQLFARSSMVLDDFIL